MLRRGNNEGTIRQRAPGRYEASVQIGGQRHWLRATTEAEARRGIADLRRRHATGELVPPSRVTVGEHLSNWLMVAGADLRPKTQLDYQYIIRIYLGPAFGRTRIQRLTPAMAARQFSEWRSDGRVSGKTLLNVFRTFHRALVVARQWGLIGTNPLDAVEPPKAAKVRPVLWSPEQASAFLASLADPQPQAAQWHSPLFTLLIGSGCRFGEAMAARWQDFDRDTGILAIRRNLVLVHGGYVEGDPKTHAGQRSIQLPPFARESLRAWRAEQGRHRLAFGADWPAPDRIITLPDGTSPKHRRAYDAFHARCSEAGVPKVRMHDLRHLHASLLLASGLPLPAVSARLGHASTAVTAAIYSHALKGSDALAANAIEDSLAPPIRTANRK